MYIYFCKSLLPVSNAAMQNAEVRCTTGRCVFYDDKKARKKRNNQKAAASQTVESKRG